MLSFHNARKQSNSRDESQTVTELREEPVTKQFY
jgi:hypothetical protein